MGKFFILGLAALLGADDFKTRESAQAYLEFEAEKRAEVCLILHQWSQSSDPEVRRRCISIEEKVLALPRFPRGVFKSEDDYSSFHGYYCQWYSPQLQSQREMLVNEWNRTPGGWELLTYWTQILLENEFKRRVFLGEAPNKVREEMRAGMYRAFLAYRLEVMAAKVRYTRWDLMSYPWFPVRLITYHVLGLEYPNYHDEG